MEKEVVVRDMTVMVCGRIIENVTAEFGVRKINSTGEN